MNLLLFSEDVSYQLDDRIWFDFLKGFVKSIIYWYQLNVSDRKRRVKWDSLVTDCDLKGTTGGSV